MTDREGPEPAWKRKSDEGKMFQRMECGRCATLFHFLDSPRVTRFPRCPRCGNTSGLSAAA